MADPNLVKQLAPIDATLGVGRVPADLLFVVDKPGSAGQGWRGGSAEDRIIRAALRTLSTEVPKGVGCHLTYAVDRHCDVPLQADLAGAKERLRHALERIRPKVVLAMGAAALEALPTASVYRQDIGRVIKAGSPDRPMLIVPTFSSSEVAGQASLHFAFVEHVRRALAALSGWTPAPPLSLVATDHVVGMTADAIERACAACDAAPVAGVLPGAVAISLTTYGDSIAALGFAWGDGQAAAAPLQHPGSPIAPDIVAARLAPLLSSPRPKVFHGATQVLAAFSLVDGLQITAATIWDTLVAQHVLSEDRDDEMTIDHLVRLYFPDWASSNGSLLDRGGAATPTAQRTLVDVLRDAAMAADLTLRAASIQAARIAAEDPEGDLRRLVEEWSAPVSRYLARIKAGGIAVDRPLLETNIRRLKEIAAAARRQMAATAGRSDFNPDAPADIVAALGTLGAPKLPTTEDGEPRCTTEVLDAWCKAEGVLLAEIADRLVAGATLPGAPPWVLFAATLRLYFTATRTGLVPLEGLKQNLQGDGRAHPELNICGTTTGRLSSGGGVNFQNLCHDETLEQGGIIDLSVREVLRAASPDKVLVQIDVKAAEVRCLAAYTKDQLLIRGFLDGKDIHCAVAVEAFGDGTYEDYVAAHEGRLDDPGRAAALRRGRTQVKRVVFGSIYGSTAYGIAKQIFGIIAPSDEQVREAQRVMDRIFALMPSLPTFIEETKREANRDHFVASLLGRRRRFPQLALNIPRGDRARCHRQAVNFKIQSLASDILVGQLAELDPHLTEIGGRSLLTVHDSGLFEIDHTKLDHAAGFFQRWITDRVAERYAWMPVPFSFDMTAGATYGSLAPLASKRTTGDNT